MSINADELMEAKNSQFLVHFFLIDESHEMDALVLHACENELFSLIKEIGKQLDVGFGIQTKAYGEGGLERYLTFTGKHAVALGLIGTAITAICSGAIWWNYQSKLLEVQLAHSEFNLQRDIKLTQQQIEQNELNLKKARIELRKLEQETSPDAEKSPATASNRSLPLEPPPKLEDILPALTTNRRLIKLRSQFYENLLSYEKVAAVGFASMHKPTKEQQKIVPRSEFASYVINLSELEPEQFENVEIEIVSPVLKRGSFKWRGIFEKRSISFEVLDEAFLTRVMSKKVKFQNGTTLQCDLKVFLRENEAGDVEVHAYSVGHVHKHFNKGSTTTVKTSSGPLRLSAAARMQALGKSNNTDGDSDLFTLPLNGA